MSDTSQGFPTESAVQNQYCSECGRPFPPSDLARFGSAAVCADCKPLFAQRMREGVVANPALPQSFIYGGFWIRGVATLLDGLIVGVMLIIGLFFSIFGSLLGSASQRLTRFLEPQNLAGLFLVFFVLLIPLQIPYYVYFLSQKGATPGKMVMGLKVLTAHGGPISVGRAFGRFFANILNGFVPFYIGYIIAAFDAEKRALHDHICGTRVIRT